CHLRTSRSNQRRDLLVLRLWLPRLFSPWATCRTGRDRVAAAVRRLDSPLPASARRSSLTCRCLVHLCSPAFAGATGTAVSPEFSLMDRDNPGALFGRSTRRGSFEKIMA